MEHLSKQACECLCLTLVPLFLVPIIVENFDKIIFLCTKQKAESHVPRAEQEVEEEEEEEEGEDLLFTSQHECPLVQQNISSIMQLQL